MKILIIEDDPDIGGFLEIGFKTEGHEVDRAMDGEKGSFMARVSTYDIIILDFSLPKKNGLVVCNEIRTQGLPVPIIFLSVSGDTNIKINALEEGADDYITKPFSFEELNARIKAIMRRPKKIESAIKKVGELSIDIQKQTAYRNEKPLYLTRKEYNLLEYLMRNPGIVHSRGMIMEHVWSAESDPFSNTIEVHILNLRKKVNSGFSRDLIRNIPGRGYVIEV